MPEKQPEEKNNISINQLDPLAMGLNRVARQSADHQTVVHCKGHAMGEGALTVIAGPCAIESAGHIAKMAVSVKAAGAHMLRGGAVKPRTSPDDFQGLGPAAWADMARAAHDQGLAVVSEVMSETQLPLALPHVDMIQVGARNMQNYALLKALGQTQHPVLLKRGQSATYREWLLAAEYILAGGNPHVVLCERGIRTFEPLTRNTLDIAAVPVLKQLTHLPVIVDPSHGTGCRTLVPAMARAAVAAGADGVMIEVHDQPDQSISDAQQALALSELPDLIGSLQAMHDLL